MYYLIVGVVVLILIVLSCRWNWWRRNQGGLAILMYHKIGIPPRESRMKKLWVEAKKFERQIDYLVKNRYNILTFAELVDNLTLGKSISDKTVIIGFDDGFENNYTEAFPILKRYNLKAVIFLTVAYIGGKSDWEEPSVEFSHPMLNWEQICEMAEYGIEFASHTLTHINLVFCQNNYKLLEYEINESKRILEEKLKQPITAFSYPYGAGAYNEKIKEIVKKAGYKTACGIKQGKVPFSPPDLFNLKRILVRGDDNMIDFRMNLKKGRARL